MKQKLLLFLVIIFSFVSESNAQDGGCLGENETIGNQACTPIYDECSSLPTSNLQTTLNICPGDSATISPTYSIPSGFTFTGYYWSPSMGISPVSDTVPGTITIQAPTSCERDTLYFTALGPNLISNGTFTSSSTECTYYPV